MNSLDTIFTLKQVYPGLEEELCSRHSIALTQIKNKFEYIYQQYKPEIFFIAKGLCQFGVGARGCDMEEMGTKGKASYMAVENGITIAISKTKPKQNIYINFNKWQQECQYLEQKIPSTQPELQSQLILNYKGQPLVQPTLQNPSHHTLYLQLSEIYKIATEDISLSKLCGGIVYIDSKLEDGCFYEREALLLGFFVAVLEINGVRGEYTVGDIVGKLSEGFKDDGKMREYLRIFNCQQHYDIVVGGKLEKINAKNKFVICKLPAMNSFKKNKENGVFEMLQQFQEGQFDRMEKSQATFEESLVAIKEYWHSIYPNYQQESVHFLSRCITSSSGFLLAQQSGYIVMLIHNPSTVPNLINQLSSHLKNQLQKQQQGTHHHDKQDILDLEVRGQPKMLGKWGRDRKMKQMLFSSQPCIGFTVLDPKEELWYQS